MLFSKNRYIQIPTIIIGNMFIEYSATYDMIHLIYCLKIKISLTIIFLHSRTTLVWKDDGPFQEDLQSYNRLGYIPELQALDLLNILFLCFVVDTQFEIKNVYIQYSKLNFF